MLWLGLIPIYILLFHVGKVSHVEKDLQIGSTRFLKTGGQKGCVSNARKVLLGTRLKRCGTALKVSWQEAVIKVNPFERQKHL